ncbi:GLUG motif-containing protein [Bacteroides timonensis]|uniref:GLUG motif-containing protein n=1 Tax=Bacteroides timonensis TaxID=1470345 RepID=UPI0004B55F48|nr:GLUG motif-containing protein [Bacteroides timonensis]
MRGAFSDLYNADMACTLTPEWDSPETGKDLISIWDGTTITQPADYTETPGEVTITSAAQLAWLAQQSDATNQKTFSGYTFTLTTDIDLKSHLWPQIGHFDNGFQGTLDGNGHTVRGVYANNGDTERYVGFINYLNNGGTVKNITIRGYVSGLGPVNTNCRFGGLVGQAKGSTIENCHNACTLVVGGEQLVAGGIAGYAENTLIKDCTNEGAIKNTGNNTILIAIGGIVGELISRESATSTLSENVNKGKIAYTSISNGGYLGGIAGNVYARETITVSNNINSGEVITTFGEYNSKNNMGGIIGQLCTFNINTGTVTISDNQNKGNVSSDYDNDRRGGIISLALGDAKMPITLTNNSITEGSPGDIVIAFCIPGGGTITVDGTPVTESGPYPEKP